jgi:hypothetical protein
LFHRFVIYFAFHNQENISNNARNKNYHNVYQHLHHFLLNFLFKITLFFYFFLFFSICNSFSDYHNIPIFLSISLFICTGGFDVTVDVCNLETVLRNNTYNFDIAKLQLNGTLHFHCYCYYIFIMLFL